MFRSFDCRYQKQIFSIKKVDWMGLKPLSFKFLLKVIWDLTLIIDELSDISRVSQRSIPLASLQSEETTLNSNINTFLDVNFLFIWFLLSEIKISARKISRLPNDFENHSLGRIHGHYWPLLFTTNFAEVSILLDTLLKKMLIKISSCE